MDSKVLISMRELSQILATTGISISTSQEEKLLIAVEILSTSPEMADKLKSQELQKDFLCKTTEEANILRIISKRKRLGIEEFLIYMTTDPSYAQTTTQLGEEDLYGIVKEGEYQD